MTPRLSTEFDVVIVGAGPAGTAAAITLRQRNLSVLVLEIASGPRWKIGETLAPAARPLLHSLGILADFEADGHLPSYGNLSAWGSSYLSATDFIFNPHSHGWQLDRERFDRCLSQAAEKLGAHIWYGSRLLEGPHQTDSGWKIQFASGSKNYDVQARWLIDASGRQNVVACLMGACRTPLDSLMCVYMIAIPSTDSEIIDRDTRTLVEATSEGWWYTALMPSGRRTVAWLTDSSILRLQPWQSPDWFSSRVNETLHVRELLIRYGYTFHDVPNCTSATSSRIEPWHGCRWLAVGDAAIAFDPLSSHGLVHSLVTGSEAGESIFKDLHGDTTSIQKYSDGLDRTWIQYVANRLGYYRMEQRWNSSRFWSHRC